MQCPCGKKVTGNKEQAYRNGGGGEGLKGLWGSKGCVMHLTSAWIFECLQFDTSRASQKTHNHGCVEFFVFGKSGRRKEERKGSKMTETGIPYKETEIAPIRHSFKSACKTAQKLLLLRFFKAFRAAKSFTSCTSSSHYSIMKHEFIILMWYPFS